jgi:hypothetical protein
MPVAFSLIYLQIDDYEAAVRKAETSGVNIRYPVTIPDADILKPDGYNPYRAVACKLHTWPLVNHNSNRAEQSTSVKRSSSKQQRSSIIAT